MSRVHSASSFVSHANDVIQNDCTPTLSHTVCASGSPSTQHGLQSVYCSRSLLTTGSSEPLARFSVSTVLDFIKSLAAASVTVGQWSLTRSVLLGTRRLYSRSIAAAATPEAAKSRASDSVPYPPLVPSAVMAAFRFSIRRTRHARQRLVIFFFCRCLVCSVSFHVSIFR